MRSCASSSSVADNVLMDGDALLADLLAEVGEDKTYDAGVEPPPSSRGDCQKREGREGEELSEDVQSPSNAVQAKLQEGHRERL